MRVAKGDRFRVIKATEKTALLYFASPFTGGFKCTLPIGTVLVTVRDSEAGDTRVFLAAENREPFESKYVSNDQKSDPKYLGFAFTFKTSDIGKILVPIT